MQKLTACLQLARPHQYVKNGFIWLPLFFGHQLRSPSALFHTLLAFIAFCLAASAVYVLNDLRDAEQDRQHPEKRLRPVASGAVSPMEARIFFVALAAAAVLTSLLTLPAAGFAVVGGYIVLNVGYSSFLKHIAVVDIICIAMGFVLRVLAGGFAADVAISPWIIMMTFLLALFLALAKRRDDLLLVDQGHATRKSLDGYNLEFVSLSMGVMASVIIVAYILYTVSPEITAKHGTSQLYLTAFWVIVGLLRYMQITFVENRSGSPTKVLLRDYMLQAVIGLWLASLYLLLY